MDFSLFPIDILPATLDVVELRGLVEWDDDEVACSEAAEIELL